MTFTYAGDMSTDLEKVRFYIQDTVSGSGPKPSDGNFTDEELGGLITVEGNWQRAVAGAFEVLSSSWTTYADIRVGPRSESYSQIAEKYAQLASGWRSRYGGSATGAGTRHPTRIDGYSSNVSADEV